LVALSHRWIGGPGEKGGCDEVGPNPTDRGRPGTKHHLLVDRQGIPLAVELSAANVPDAALLEPLLDSIPPIQQPIGRSRFRPDKLHGDKAFDSRKSRASCRARGIVPRIARRGVESPERLGRYRWVVERSIAWVHRFRQLLIRYERRSDIHRGFLTLAAIVVCSASSGSRRAFETA
jgi:transposase